MSYSGAPGFGLVNERGRKRERETRKRVAECFVRPLTRTGKNSWKTSQVLSPERRKEKMEGRLLISPDNLKQIVDKFRLLDETTCRIKHNSMWQRAQ